MTPIDLCLIGILIAAVLASLYLALMRAFHQPLEWLTQDASLDPVQYQPRASTEPEPTDRQSLLCVVLILVATGLLALLWCGYADGLVRWAAAR